MNNATIMGKIKNAPKINKLEDGKEEAIFSVEYERDFKNANGKKDKDVIECRYLEPDENFKEDFAKGTSVAVKGKIYNNKKQFGEYQIDNLSIDVTEMASLSKNQNLSSVSVLGYLVADPEVRETTNGKKVTNVVVAAVKENRNDETDYIRATVWGARADNLGKYCGKGDLINISGKLRNNSRENETDKVNITELVAEDIIYIQSKNHTNSIEQEKEADKEQEV